MKYYINTKRLGKIETTRSYLIYFIMMKHDRSHEYANAHIEAMEKCVQANNAAFHYTIDSDQIIISK